MSIAFQVARTLNGPNEYFHGYFDDFDWLITVHRWTTQVADGGAVTIDTSVAGGRVKLTDASASDNDEVYVGGSNATFLFANQKPLWFEASIQFAEANTSAANVGIGLMSTAVGADMLLDDGGGPAASYTGALFFKVDGGTTWNVESSVGATQTTYDTTITAGGSSAQRVAIEFMPRTSTVADLSFFLDRGGTSSKGFELVRKQNYTYTSAAAVKPVVLLKHGSTTTETVYCDYVRCFQLR